MTYKRGKVYWYKFMWQGNLIRESSKQGNKRTAEQMEAAHRADLARGLVGIQKRKPAPMLRQFVVRNFWPWVEATFDKRGKTFLWFRNSRDRLLESPIAAVAIDKITGEHVSDHVAKRRADGLAVASINAELRVLRRMVRLAVEWEILDRRAPRVKMVAGERQRDRVVTHEEEGDYLGKAADLLKAVAAVLVETGLRPEECFRLRWEFVTFETGTLRVTHGKTRAARRSVPLTPRARAILEFRHDAQGKPAEGWVWLAKTVSGHIEPSSLKGQHRKALKASKVSAFRLYDLRHTFLTRLGESGCDAWTLARIAGHADIRMSARYVHPSEKAVHAAIKTLGGHKTGHSVESGESEAAGETR